MSDVLTITDLETAKKHDTFHSEVITGKAGGLADGANIDTATNAATGQVQITLPKILHDVGFKPASFNFVTGGTLGVADADKCIYNPAPSGDDNWYSWGGVFPHDVAPGTDPKAVGSGYVPRTDVVLRDELASPSGVALVGGAASFESVSVLQRNDNRSMAVIAGKLIAGTSAGTKIHFFGDSTMWGSEPAPNTTVQQATNPPAMFKIALDILYPGNGVTVANKAIAGSSLYSLIRGINHYYPTTYEQMIAADTPTVAYMGHCLNDCSSADSDTNISQYYNDLIEFVDITRAYGVIPVLVTPAIHSPIFSGTVSQTNRQESFIQAMRDVAAKKEVDLVDSNHYMQRSLPLWSPMSIAPDGVHLSPMFSSQHGFNMLIPLVRPHMLKKHGDLAGLSNTVWQDNIPASFNKVTNSAGSRFGPVLLAEGSATEQRVNFPILLDAATKGDFIAFGGSSWDTHGVSNVTYFSGYGTTGVLSGDINASTSAASSDALFAPAICRLPAGLSIVGVSFPANTQIGKVMTFSGVSLLERDFSGVGILSQGYANAAKRDILAGDIVTCLPVLQPGDSLLKLCSSYDGSTQVNIVWSSSTGKLEIQTQGTTTVLFDSPATGLWIGLEVTVGGASVVVKWGGVTKSVSGLPNAFPRMHVGNPIPYHVNRP